MERKRTFLVGGTFLIVLVGLGMTQAALERAAAQQGGIEAPRFEVDPFWPKPLPNHWVLGQTIGVWVDDQDVVWIIHRELRDARRQREGARAEDRRVLRRRASRPRVRRRRQPRAALGRTRARL